MDAARILLNRDSGIRVGLSRKKRWISLILIRSMIPIKAGFLSRRTPLRLPRNIDQAAAAVTEA